ncbi:MAG TPA: hypothetical protein VFL90_12975 [Methylomirabilota bacterium]|nr:hypothetical protein [Methylomirabilota bacterium]
MTSRTLVSLAVAAAVVALAAGVPVEAQHRREAASHTAKPAGVAEGPENPEAFHGSGTPSMAGH